MSTGAVTEATEGKRNNALAGRHGGGLVARFEQRCIAVGTRAAAALEPLRFVGSVYQLPRPFAWTQASSLREFCFVKMPAQCRANPPY